MREGEFRSRVDVPPVCCVCRQVRAVFLEGDHGTIICSRCVDFWSTHFKNITLRELLEFLDGFREFKLGLYGA